MYHRLLVIDQNPSGAQTSHRRSNLRDYHSTMHFHAICLAFLSLPFVFAGDINDTTTTTTTPSPARTPTRSLSPNVMFVTPSPGRAAAAGCEEGQGVMYHGCHEHCVNLINGQPDFKRKQAAAPGEQCQDDENSLKCPYGRGWRMG